MVDTNFAQIHDKELLKLFAVNKTPALTKRMRQIKAELERRGYLYDPIHNDFLTCEEWNIRYIKAQRECDKQTKFLL